LRIPLKYYFSLFIEPPLLNFTVTDLILPQKFYTFLIISVRTEMGKAILKADEISIQGRIIAIADAYCTMTAERPYSRVFTAEEAIAEIKNNSGFQFDKKLAQIFVEKVLQKEWPKA